MQLFNCKYISIFLRLNIMKSTRKIWEITNIPDS
jgi:hypothetical protein